MALDGSRGYPYSGRKTMLSRRELLGRCGMGLGALAFQSFFAQLARAGDPVNPLKAKTPHFKGKAKRVLHIFANGGPSHIDTFDPKPLLEKYRGKKLPRENPATERKT